MPKYLVTITDEDYELVKDNIIESLEISRKQAIPKGPVKKLLQAAQQVYEKEVGFSPMFIVVLTEEWLDEKRCIIRFETDTADPITGKRPFNTKYYDKKITGLKEAGKIRIERLDENGNVEELVYDGN